MINRKKFHDSFEKMMLNPDTGSSVIKKYYSIFRNEKYFEYKSLIDLIDAEYKCEFGAVNDCDLHLNVGFAYEEDAIESLFKSKPDNNELNDIIPKVSIINQLYSAGLNSVSGGRHLSIIEMANHIFRLRGQIDEYKISDDVLSLVTDLSKDNSIKTYDGASKYKAVSFSTKYLSFSLREKGFDAVPITDSKARTALAFIYDKSANYYEDYENYFNDITALKEKLTKVSYKEIDAFLWIMGKALTS